MHNVVLRAQAQWNECHTQCCHQCVRVDVYSMVKTQLVSLIPVGSFPPPLLCPQVA